jgi:hypothetical protein
MSQWTNSGLVAQQQEVFAGSYAARGTSTGLATYARRAVSPARTELYYSLRFKIISRGSNSVYFMRFRSADNMSILGVYIANNGKLSYRNDVARVVTNSNTPVTLGAWHELQVRARINGSTGEVEVWYDGARITALSKTESLGTAQISFVQLGENATGLSYDLAFDQVAVSTGFIGTTSTATPTVTPTGTSSATSTVTGTSVATGTATIISTSTNTSTPTQAPTATLTSTVTASITPAGPGLFEDGFETGNMSQWSSSVGLVVQQQEVFSNSYAARGTTTNAAMYAYEDLSTGQNDIYYRLRFKLISQGPNTVYLMKFRTGSPSDASILGVYISNAGKLGYRNDTAGGGSVTSKTSITAGVWHELQARVRINGSAGEVAIWLNGSQVADLSKTENLGATPVKRLQLGDNTTARTYDIAYDEIAASSIFITTSIGQGQGNKVAPTHTSQVTATSTPTPTPSPTGTRIPEATSTEAPALTPSIPASATVTMLPVVTSTLTPTAIPTKTRLENRTLIAVADAYVSQADPRTNYGIDSALRIGSSAKDVTRGYLRFDIGELPATEGAAKISRATLQLFPLDKPVGAGVEVHTVIDTTWKETYLNYANSPGPGDLLGVLKPSSSGWVGLDVTDLLNSDTDDGSYSLALITGGSATFASRESGDRAPRLIIEISP